MPGVLSGGACGAPLTVSALSTRPSLLASTVLVRGSRSLALVPHDVDARQRTFLFSSEDCVSGRERLYLQSLGPKPQATTILDIPAGWRLVDAVWAKAVRVPVALLRDPSGGYVLQSLRGGTWTPIWRSVAPPPGGQDLVGLEAKSGFEFRMWSTSTTAWTVWHLNGSGTLRPVLQGDGELRTVQSNFGDTLDAIVTSSDSWVCDWTTKGVLVDAVVAGDCSRTTLGPGFGAVFTEASGGRDSWIFVANGETSLARVTCAVRDFITCSEPTVGPKRRSPLRAAGPTMVHILVQSASQVRKLGSSKV